ncbi:SURF1 family protein [Citricoccus sp. I39-566]|uniref:SURF1 family cytochrome oxidase biogenesis protein n=1 Tax=Citricoccus sp. I39-566 TaxID=3073268 RepID=UPI00286B00D4|nr:SURF1 family protein [Citricoccus sp. I39-566]WMY79975.1 SURF1 family protein [Citricoccus sp. I39-566]
MRTAATDQALRARLDFRFLLSPQWLGGLVFCAVIAVACALLGQWQMDRRTEAVAEINKVLANYDDPAVPLARDAELFTRFQAEQEWTPVEMTGEYLEEDTRIVRNRPLAGKPGYEVLVPFRADTGEVIVVNRGWLPIGNDTPGRPDTVPAPPEGRVTVVARLKPGEPTLDRDAPQGQLPSIDLAAFEESVGYPVADTAYGQLADEIPTPKTTLQQPPKPPLDEGPHLSYSLQWFMFGLMSFIVWGYTARQKAVNDRDDRELGLTEDDGYLSAHRPPRARPVRRRGGRPTDEEVEDALLDAADLRR